MTPTKAKLLHFNRALGNVHEINSALMDEALELFGDDSQIWAKVGDANCDLCEALGALGDWVKENVTPRKEDE